MFYYSLLILIIEIVTRNATIIRVNDDIMKGKVFDTFSYVYPAVNEPIIIKISLKIHLIATALPLHSCLIKSVNKATINM